MVIEGILMHGSGMDFNFIICVIGLFLVIEGLPWAAMPYRIKGMLRQLLEVPEPALRIAGLVMMALGVFLVWVGRR